MYAYQDQILKYMYSYRYDFLWWPEWWVRQKIRTRINITLDYYEMHSAELWNFQTMPKNTFIQVISILEKKKNSPTKSCNKQLTKQKLSYFWLHCSRLVWYSAFVSAPAKRAFRDLSAWQTGRASCSNSCVLTKWWQRSDLLFYKDSWPHMQIQKWKLLPFCPGGGTFVISGWGCAAGTLEPSAYTRASSAELCYPILE